MPDAKPVSPELINQMSKELVGTPVPEKDRQAVASLVASLAAEMASLRALDVGEADPATVYEASGE